MKIPAHIRYGDDWTLLFDPFYRNRKLWLRLIPQRIINRIGLHRQYGELRCALGIYERHAGGGWCGWCGKHHGRQTPRWSSLILGRK
jgi:hypothetical protein